jgi:hypothetical protein
MAYTFQTDPTATLKVSVATNENGNIATTGQTAAGNTNISLKGIKKDATHTQAKAVLDAIIGGVVGGTYDERNLEGTIKFRTVETD